MIRCLFYTALAFAWMLLPGCSGVAIENAHDSYWLSERYTSDCQFYAMRFYRADTGCTLRVAMSGGCGTVTADTFLRNYRALIRENDTAIRRVPGSYIMILVYGPALDTATTFAARLAEETERLLGIRLSAADTIDGALRYRILGLKALETDGVKR